MPTVAELEKRIDRQDELISDIQKNHDGLSEKMIRIDAKMEVYNNDLKRMSDKMTEVANDVKALMLKPGKRYESLTLTIITSLITMVLGFLAAHILQ